MNQIKYHKMAGTKN